MRCGKGCCKDCISKYFFWMKAIFTCVFYFVFLPSATLFTVTVALVTCTQSLKRLAFLVTGSYSFDGLPEPASLIISVKEFIVGSIVSIFLALCFFAFIYFYNKKVRKGNFGDILPYESNEYVRVESNFQKIERATDVEGLDL